MCLLLQQARELLDRVDIYVPDDFALADSHVSICRLRPGVNSDYIVEFLRSEYGQIQMLRHVSGSTGQTELLQGHLRALLYSISRIYCSVIHRIINEERQSGKHAP